MATSLEPLAPGWARPFPRDERVWLAIVIIGALIMSVVTVGWLWLGKQNVPISSYKTTPGEFEKKVEEFQKKFEVAPGVVRVPPGEDAYLMAKMWVFTPQLRLKAGQTYTIWLSSKDVLHGLSIADQNLNIMAVPGHAYGIKITPTTPGEYLIFCNEYCGLGHHAMQGKIIVE